MQVLIADSSHPRLPSHKVSYRACGGGLCQPIGTWLIRPDVSRTFRRGPLPGESHIKQSPLAISLPPSSRAAGIVRQNFVRPLRKRSPRAPQAPRENPRRRRKRTIDVEKARRTTPIISTHTWPKRIGGGLHPGPRERLQRNPPWHRPIAWARCRPVCPSTDGAAEGPLRCRGGTFPLV